MEASNSLIGVWQPLSAELGGEEAPGMLLAKMEVELTSNTYTVRFGGVAADHGNYTIEPAGLTLTGVAGPNAGRTIPCVFQFAAGGLEICYGLGGVRPAGFSTGRDPQLYRVTYARKR